MFYRYLVERRLLYATLCFRLGLTKVRGAIVADAAGLAIVDNFVVSCKYLKNLQS